MFELEEKDLRDAMEIEKTMDTPGWKILAEYVSFGREHILDAGKDGIRTRQKRELSAEKWAVLKGWDEFKLLPERIIKRAHEFLAEEKSRREDIYGPDGTTTTDPESN